MKRAGTRNIFSLFTWPNRHATKLTLKMSMLVTELSQS